MATDIKTDGSLKIEEWPTAKPKPYPANPRKITDEAVAKVAASIEAYGFQQPIVVDADGMVIVGHARLKAATKLGLKTVPVVVADLTPEKARAYRLADNRANEETGWEIEGLAEELESLEAMGTDLALTMFDDDEIDQMLRGEKSVREVKPIATSEVEDVFWISIRGPLRDQAKALQLLTKAMADLPMVEVELGISVEVT